MRILIDTNIWISGTVFSGAPAEVLDLVLKKGFCDHVTCQQIILELTSNLEEKFNTPKQKVRKLVWEILKISDLVEPSGTLKIIEGNIGDNLVLEAAAIGKVQYLITGDKRHLLPLKRYKTVKIISAKDFLELLKK